MKKEQFLGLALAGLLGTSSCVLPTTESPKTPTGSSKQKSGIELVNKTEHSVTVTDKHNNQSKVLKLSEKEYLVTDLVPGDRSDSKEITAGVEFMRENNCIIENISFSPAGRHSVVTVEESSKEQCLPGLR